MGAVWLERLLSNMEDGGAPVPLVAAAKSEAPAMQIAILRACVEAMPALRAQGRAWARGAAVYELAIALYGARLPLTEQDVVALLSSSRHGCGHGEDVSPPIELAIRHARKHGLSDELASAVRSFACALGPVVSAKARNAKRKASFLLVLRPDERSDPSDWSRTLSAAVLALPAPERRAWEDAVLHMALNDGTRAPAAWSKKSSRLIAELGADRVLELLERCWPASGADVRFETAASHVMKNVVWLLEALSVGAPHCVSQADALVTRLAALDYSARDRSEKVGVAAALYLAKRPAVIALEPLLRLHARTRARAGGDLIGDALRSLEAGGR